MSASNSHAMARAPSSSPARAPSQGLAARRIYIHINNTNPMLVSGSPERRAVEAAGFEVAEDGMEIVL